MTNKVCLVYRENGERDRIKLQLDDRDDLGDSYQVTFGDDVYAVSTSYIKGLFGPSVELYSNEYEFRDHIIVVGDERIQNQIRQIINRMYFEKTFQRDVEPIEEKSKMSNVIPYLWYLAGSICFAVGTIISIVNLK